jgi:DNA (cytosine-5)-methyltransferase 1
MNMHYTEHAALSFIDLFCGCGGNSWGMSYRDDDFALKPLLAVDIDEIALATYKQNMPGAEILKADIRDVSYNDVLKIIGLTPGELGCIVASPPCQTYSRNNRLPKSKSDHRNTLYVHTLELIGGIKPLIVFMENVPEMTTFEQGKYHKDFVAKLERLDYKVLHWIVNATNYGIPQNRPRLIYLAYHHKLNALPQCPVETHGEKSHLLSKVTVEEAIGDLPLRSPNESSDKFIVDDEQISKRSSYALDLRPKRSNIVTNHLARKLSETQIERLEALKEGQAYKELPEHLKPVQGYAASYGRMWRDKPSPTLTTYLAYPGSGRFSHYAQNRVITIREALRLQSFDDDFEVLGNLIQQSTQVGNAVPPMLVRAFRKSFMNHLYEYIGQGKTK